MNKFSVFIVFLFLITVCMFADFAVENYDVDLIKDQYSISPNFKHTTPVLVTPEGNYRGIIHPGRNIICHGDTVAIVFSQTTTNPNDFQKLYQSYSEDGGATWTNAAIGVTECMRTYPHTTQIYDIADTIDPLGIDPHLIWLERHYPGGTGETFFSHDDLVPFQLFTPRVIDSVIGYFPTMVAWGTGDTLFATAADPVTQDVYGWTSNDHGINWSGGTIVPPGSVSEHVAPMVGNGKDGYGFLYYAIQEAAGQAKIPFYMETTDYGANFTSSETLMYVWPSANPRPLSMTWMGYSCIVDPVSDIPYVAVKLDTNADVNYSFNYGEIYFTKPNGGTPGSYTFDTHNPVGVVVNDPNTFEHLAGYPTIGFYRDQSENIVLYIIFSAYADTVIGTDTIYTKELWAATSIDEGNTWNLTLATHEFNTMHQFYYPSASYFVDNETNGSIHVVYLDGPDGFDPQDLDDVSYYHIAFDVVNDLGLPAPGSYSVGVEEAINETPPSMYDIKAIISGKSCNFAISVPNSGMTSLKIFDISGREVAELVNRHLSAGNYQFNFNSGNLSSGTYMYRLVSDGYSQTGKIFFME